MATITTTTTTNPVTSLLAATDHLYIATWRLAQSQSLRTPSAVLHRLLVERWRAQSTWLVTECLPIIKSAGIVAVEARGDKDKPTDEHIHDVWDQVGARFDEFEDAKGTDTAINDVIVSALKAGADVAYDLAGMGGMSFDLKSIAARDYLAKYGFALLSKTLDRTTRDQIRSVVINGISKGTPYSSIVTQVKGLLINYYTLDYTPRRAAGRARSRAQLIISTELGNAFSDGSLGAALRLDRMGYPMEKFWLTAGDDKVDPQHCAMNESNGWVAVGQPFHSGDQRPLAHPGCRCALLTRRVITRLAA